MAKQYLATLDENGKIPKSQLPSDLGGDSSGITEETVADWGFTKNTGDYSKPDGGIPKSDLANDVQSSLDKADSCIVSINGISPDDNGNITYLAGIKRLYTGSCTIEAPFGTNIGEVDTDLYSVLREHCYNYDYYLFIISAVYNNRRYIGLHEVDTDLISEMNVTLNPMDANSADIGIFPITINFFVGNTSDASVAYRVTSTNGNSEPAAVTIKNIYALT